MKNSIQDGLTLRYTSPRIIYGGDLVVLPAMVGVAYTAMGPDDMGVLAVEGVFELPKDASELALGQTVYATKEGIITGVATDNTPAGKCWQASGTKDGTVRVKINV